jgi:hypothetical protein
MKTKTKQLSFFRISGYDPEIAIKAETLMSEPFRPYGSALSDGTAPACHSRASGNPGLGPKRGWTPPFAGMTDRRQSLDT